MTDKKIKLHLGCGEKYIPGFVHIDVIKFKHIDHNIDIEDLSIYDDCSVDLIYASHVLEHFKRHDIKKVLKEWLRVLKHDGVLRLAVPDFEKIVDIYNKLGDLNLVIGLICGGQTYAENSHHVVFDFNTIKSILEDVGFKDIHRYDWRKTEHKDIDDFSQAYIPHLDKENGELMSLNVEAIK